LMARIDGFETLHRAISEQSSLLPRVETFS
jgi:hypothetical protein